LIQISITVQRTAYIPGEEVEGKVILYCDEYFKCRKGTFEIGGVMTYRTVRFKVKGKAKVSTEPVELSWFLHRAVSVFAENMEFNPGTYEFNFQFQLPDDLKPSYQGQAVSIVYNLNTTMEISSDLKVGDVAGISILHPITEHPSKGIERSDSAKYLRIRMDSQKFYIGDDLTFSYCIVFDKKFEALRVEIEHLEHYYVNRNKILLAEEIPSENVALNEWKKIVLSTKNKQIPVSFDYEKLESYDNKHSRLKSSLTLKFTIVKRHGDSRIEIPLITGHDLRPGWRENMGTFGPGTRKIRPTMTKINEPTGSHLSDEERVSLNWYNRAIAFREEGEINEAIRSVEKALELHPESVLALALREELKSYKE